MEWLSKWKAIIQTPPFSLPFNISGSFFIPPNARTPPYLAIHHIHYLIPPVLPFFLHSHFSQCSSAFIISAFYSFAFNLLFHLALSLHPMCSLTCHSTFLLPSTIFYSPLSSHSYCFSFYFFIWEPLTELVTKALYDWAHLHIPYFCFEVSTSCVLVIKLVKCVAESKSSRRIGAIICPVQRSFGNRQCVLLFQSFEANVFVVVCSDSFHDLCCMSCHTASPLSVLSLTTVFLLMKQKSQKLHTGQKLLELFSIWLQAADRQ